MFRIGEFSYFAKTTVKTLRFYDEIDLFKPSFVDNNGYRYYSIEDLAKLQLIIELRSYEMPIEKIKKILAGDEIKKILIECKNEIKKNLDQNKQNLSLINKLIAKSEKGDIMKKYEVKLTELPKCIVYYRHGIIDTMSDINAFILEAGEECRINNPDLKCTGYCFVTYEAEGYQKNNVELEYAEAVEKVGNESKNIKFKKLDSQKALITQHKGPYSELGKAYAYAVNYAKENSFEITDKIRECYIHGCWDTDKEDNYLTEIQIPIK